jgi:hypothetical protein
MPLQAEEQNRAGDAKPQSSLIAFRRVDIPSSIPRRFRPALPLLTISSSLVCSLLERSVKFTKRDLRT